MSMKKSVLKQLDKSMVQYFTDLGLAEKDFWCTECGKCLVDIEDLKKFRYITRQKRKDLPVKTPYLIKVEGDEIVYINTGAEPEEYRWLLRGKYLSESNKRVFRHICWDCFFKLLPTIVDIKRAARKSKWYKLIMEGNKPIPLGNIASSDYFKLLFYITDEEIQAEKLKLATASLAKFIRKYGPEEGKKKHDEYCARQAYTCSKEYMKETRGWTDEQWNEFNASRASTEENFIRRYGEEFGKKKWQEYCANEAYAGNTLEYFIDKYGKENGEKEYKRVCKEKATTLENFIRIYGEENGKIKWNEHCKKLQVNFSKISQQLFKSLDKHYLVAKQFSEFATKNQEKSLSYTIDNNFTSVIFLDYTLFNKVIEFNGDYWHANPTKYSSNSQLLRNGKIVTAQECWNNDKKRIDFLEKLGYKVKVVWESDYYENKNKIISDCVEFLKS